MSNNKQVGFVTKLKEIVLFNESCLHLHENNQGFTITNSQQFELEVLPLYFQKSNYQSFKRQLNLYGFTYNKNNKGQMSFHHEKFNFKLDGSLKRKTTKQNFQTFEEDLHLIQQNLFEIRANQECMANQIKQINAMQNSIVDQINHLKKIYLQNKVNGCSRGKRLGNFLNKFYKNMKDEKYKKFLRKNYLKAVQITNYAYNEDYFIQCCTHYEPTCFYPKITIYFDFPLTINQSQNNSGNQLSIKQNDSDEQDDRLSVSNISNYFNF